MYREEAQSEFFNKLLARMVDHTTKILLGLIAVALWVNLALRFAEPATVKAQDFSTMERYLRAIESDVDDIEDGTCFNKKISN